MKLFPIQEQSSQFDKITSEMTNLICAICEKLSSKYRVELLHMSLFLFHCQAKVVSYHSFDRFIYACAAIFMSSKLTENMDFRPSFIISILRIILRERKGMMFEEDNQQKLKVLTKKLFEAQITIMINIGFDFDIELAIFWVHQWSKAIKDNHIIKKVQETITSLYQTSTVLYFKPQLIALTALSIVVKNQGINLSLCDWDASLVQIIKQSEQKIKEVNDIFSSKQRFIYS